MDNVNGRVYPLFVNNKRHPEDTYLFKADGIITHDFERQTYKIEPRIKSNNDSYAGNTFIYNDQNRNIVFEGGLTFVNNDENFSITASGLGVGKPDSAKYFIDAMLGFNMKVHPNVVNAFADDVLDIIERLGADVAHDNSIELIYKLSDIIGDPAAKRYENNSLKDYVPLVDASPELVKTFMISNVDLRWNDEHKSVV